MNEDSKRAAIARQTAELVTAYCENLEIRPTDLPALIAYVGSVLSRAQSQPEPGALRLSLAGLFPPAQVICLDQYRKAQQQPLRKSA